MNSKSWQHKSDCGLESNCWVVRMIGGLSRRMVLVGERERVVGLRLQEIGATDTAVMSILDAILRLNVLSALSARKLRARQLCRRRQRPRGNVRAGSLPYQLDTPRLVGAAINPRATQSSKICSALPTKS